MNWKETVKKYERDFSSLSDKQKQVFGILEHMDYGELSGLPADRYDEIIFDAVSKIDEDLLKVIIELYSKYGKSPYNHIDIYENNLEGEKK